MQAINHSDLEVLVLAPFGNDAESASQVLRRSGMEARPLKTFESLRERLKQPAGALLIAEEALTRENAKDLGTRLSRQLPWSSMPVILMSSKIERVLNTEQILEHLGQGGQVSLLERPFRIVTLLSSVKVAIQSRQRQYQVRDLLTQRELAVQQRDEFLSIASHELKTPITSLKLHVQMRKRFLQRGDASVFSPEKVLGLLETTETQLNRLSRLVDDMLDISRIVNGKLSLTRQRTCLGTLVREVAVHFAGQFEAAGSPLDLDLDESVYGIWDAYRIEQVIANLFTNAIKYGSGKPVSVSVKSLNGMGVLAVQDHGMGIAQENIDRIFQRFERAVPGSAPSGLGLGLYITRQILELHHGDIRVESELGEGSKFIVELPLEEEERLYATPS